VTNNRSEPGHRARGKENTKDRASTTVLERAVKRRKLEGTDVGATVVLSQLLEFL
jgi:hypothetical protein